MTVTPDDLVRREVHYCVSALVSTLASGNGAIEGAKLGSSARALSDLTEQADELCYPIDDYEDAAINAGWTKREFAPNVIKWWNVNNDDGSRYVNSESGLRHLCDDHDIEPYQREVYEHWIVSDWLADKLEAHGEKVDRDFAGLAIWARTTTGQGIASDYVIEQICGELNR